MVYEMIVKKLMIMTFKHELEFGMQKWLKRKGRYV